MSKKILVMPDGNWLSHALRPFEIAKPDAARVADPLTMGSQIRLGFTTAEGAVTWWQRQVAAAPAPSDGGIYGNWTSTSGNVFQIQNAPGRGFLLWLTRPGGAQQAIRGGWVRGMRGVQFQYWDPQLHRHLLGNRCESHPGGRERRYRRLVATPGGCAELSAARPPDAPSPSPVCGRRGRRGVAPHPAPAAGSATDGERLGGVERGVADLPGRDEPQPAALGANAAGAAARRDSREHLGPRPVRGRHGPRERARQVPRVGDGPGAARERAERTCPLGGC